MSGVENIKQTQKGEFEKREKNREKMNTVGFQHYTPFTRVSTECIFESNVSVISLEIQPEMT